MSAPLPVLGAKSLLKDFIMGWQAAPSKIETQWRGSRPWLICQTRPHSPPWLLTLSHHSQMGDSKVCVHMRDHLFALLSRLQLEVGLIAGLRSVMM